MSASTKPKEMKKTIAFRPGVIGNNTAFECMALIYKYLQTHHGYHFTLVKSDNDAYFDPELETITLATSCWKPIPRTPFFLNPLSSGKKCLSFFQDAELILTVDPTIYPQGLLAIRAGRRLGIPVWFDASVTTMGAGRSLAWKIMRPIYRRALHQTTGIIVTVPKCLERFRDIGLFDEVIAPRFAVMGHPVDTSFFSPGIKTSDKDGILRIIVISRLTPEKGLYYILEALDGLLKEKKNLRLIFVGQGPMKNLLIREIHSRNLEAQVECVPGTPHRELPQILNQADIYMNHAVAISGWEEFFGAANLEAMACGLPCILTKSGGISYAVREKDVALFVEERNIAEIRSAVEALVDSRERRLELGRRARDYVKRHYTLPLIAEKYHRMLHGALDS